MLEMLVVSKDNYERELILVDEKRKELFVKNRELKKTLKTVEMLREQGIEVVIPDEVKEPMKEIEQLDLDRKILKSIIRRYDSVIEMYS